MIRKYFENSVFDFLHYSLQLRALIFEWVNKSTLQFEVAVRVRLYPETLTLTLILNPQCAVFLEKFTILVFVLGFCGPNLILFLWLGLGLGLISG